MKKEQEFRINEYSDHFTISKKVIVEKYKTIFHMFFCMPQKTEGWHLINKNGQALSVYNCKTETKFNTKEDCLKWIEYYKKYPIYHYVN